MVDDETDENTNCGDESRKTCTYLTGGGRDCVRCLSSTGHSLSVLPASEARWPPSSQTVAAGRPGVRLVEVPTPLHCAGIDDCLVGRLRQDMSEPDGRGLAMFISGDTSEGAAVTLCR